MIPALSPYNYANEARPNQSRQTSGQIIGQSSFLFIFVSFSSVPETNVVWLLRHSAARIAQEIPVLAVIRLSCNTDDTTPILDAELKPRH